MNIDQHKLRPVEQYIRMQNRFKHFKQKDILEIQAEADRNYAKLRKGEI